MNGLYILIKYLCSVVLHLRDMYVFVCFVWFLLASSCFFLFLSVSPNFCLFLPIITVPFSFFLGLLCFLCFSFSCFFFKLIFRDFDSLLNLTPGVWH